MHHEIKVYYFARISLVRYQKCKKCGLQIFAIFGSKLVNYLIHHAFMSNSSQLKKHYNAFAISKVVAMILILINTFYINKIIHIFRGTF
jgi:Ca2+/Na+ antiporter